MKRLTFTGLAFYALIETALNARVYLVAFGHMVSTDALGSAMMANVHLTAAAALFSFVGLVLAYKGMEVGRYGVTALIFCHGFSYGFQSVADWPYGFGDKLLTCLPMVGYGLILSASYYLLSMWFEETNEQEKEERTWNELNKELAKLREMREGFEACEEELNLYRNEVPEIRNELETLRKQETHQARELASLQAETNSLRDEAELRRNEAEQLRNELLRTWNAPKPKTRNPDSIKRMIRTARSEEQEAVAQALEQHLKSVK